MSYTPDFEAFWSAYPRRIAKKAAYLSFNRAIRDGATVEQILKSVEAYKNWLFNSGDAWRPEPAHPSTWLNQGRWEDELEDVKPAAPVLVFKLSDNIMKKLRSGGLSDQAIHRWFNEALFIENDHCIVLKTEFIKDYISRNFASHLQRGFGFMPELSLGIGRELRAG